MKALWTVFWLAWVPCAHGACPDGTQTRSLAGYTLCASGVSAEETPGKIRLREFSLLRGTRSLLEKSGFNRTYEISAQGAALQVDSVVWLPVSKDRNDFVPYLRQTVTADGATSATCALPRLDPGLYADAAESARRIIAKARKGVKPTDGNIGYKLLLRAVQGDRAAADLLVKNGPAHLTLGEDEAEGFKECQAVYRELVEHRCITRR